MAEIGKTFSNAMVFDEGESVGFRVTAEDGQSVDIRCTLPEIGDVVFFLAALAKAAGGMRDVEPPKGSSGYNYLTPIPAQGMGFQPGPGPDQTLLVMRLTGFDLAFAVANSALVAVADGFARTARTLSAGQAKPN